MFPSASTRTGGPEYNVGQIYSFQGLDRISSEMYLEVQPNNLFYFPFITSPLIMAQNIIDDESGALDKRPGSELYLDNPDGQPVQELIQFTSYSDSLMQQLRISGNHIYSYAYSGNSWGSPIYTSSGNNIHWSHASLNGYLHLTNGVDPLLYYDGVQFYEVVNGALSTTLAEDLSPFIGTEAEQSVYVDSIEGFNPTNAFIQVGNSPMQEVVTTNEIIKYSGVAPSGNGASYPSFTVPSPGMRSYNGTTYPTQLYSSITSTQTTVPVYNTNGYPPSGYIQVDSEVIYYPVITPGASGLPPTFGSSSQPCTRGERGTTAASHNIGAALGIYWIAGSGVWVYYGTPPTSPKVLFQIANRLWAFNSSEHGGSSHIWITESNGDPTDSFNWMLAYNSESTGNGTFTGVLNPASAINFYLDPENGQQITDVGEVNNQLLVAKESSLYSIQLANTGLPASIMKLSSQYGCPSIHNFVHNDSNLFMLNGFGALTTNSSKPVLQSYQITDLIQGIDTGDLSSIYGGKHNYKVFYSVGNVTEAPWFGSHTYENAVLVYNYLTTHWYLWTYPFLINCFSEMYSSPDTDKNLYLYYGDTDGNTYTNAGYLSTNNIIFNDAGQDIPIMIKTRYFFFQQPATTKTFRDITMICENGTNASVYYSAMGDNTTTNYMYVGALPAYINRFDFPDVESRIWRGISYEIVESSSSRFRLLGIEQEYEITFMNT